MITPLVLLLLSQVASGPICTSSEDPAPKASQNVETILVSAMKDPKSQELTMSALRTAKSQGDLVGEAEAEFQLAKLQFQHSGTWSDGEVRKAVAVCKRAGCEPEITTALFRWAKAAGPESSVAKQAVGTVFSLTGDGIQRPIDLADALWRGAMFLDDGRIHSTDAVRSQNLALSILQNELSRAVSANNHLREGQIRASIASKTYRPGQNGSVDDLRKASREYLGAGAAFSKAGCKLGFSDARMIEALAQDAEREGQLDLAAKLYRELLDSTTGYDRIPLLKASANIAERRGQTKAASDLRREADEIRKTLPAPGMSSHAGPQPPRQSPWDPPEIPGGEGGTPGVRDKKHESKD